MADLVVIVPSRGRPRAVAQMAGAFRETCTADTELLFAVDEDDPALDEYSAAARELVHGDAAFPVRVGVCDAPSTMVRTLNSAARSVLEGSSIEAVGFQGDDHRPRTKGWDAAYLDALRTTPGMAYGNDLIQGASLPTQVAISAEVVRALGHMAPPVLRHMYVDNYWLELGRATGCITYLRDVIVEHLHPAVGKASWDEGYRRVNAQEVFASDEAAMAAYWAEHRDRDVLAVRSALAGVTR